MSVPYRNCPRGITPQSTIRQIVNYYLLYMQGIGFYVPEGLKFNKTNQHLNTRHSLIYLIQLHHPEIRHEDLSVFFGISRSSIIHSRKFIEDWQFGIPKDRKRFNLLQEIPKFTDIVDVDTLYEHECTLS